MECWEEAAGRTEKRFYKPAAYPPVFYHPDCGQLSGGAPAAREALPEPSVPYDDCFSNVGFMAIPLVSSVYGEECVFYVSFYILIYNILLYTYGIHLISGGKKEKDRFKKADESRRGRLPGIRCGFCG